jgi:osmoprotectant transport system ATP-binding protein
VDPIVPGVLQPLASISERQQPISCCQVFHESRQVLAMADQSFLELRHVSKRSGTQLILEDVSLSISAGSFVALVGRSGAGKTTLLKTINRLIQPDEGSIILEGEDVRTMAGHALRRRIGYAFQGIGLFPHMNVAENIAMVPRLLGTGPEERNRRVSELLQLVALPQDFATRFPRTLSGGQAQRVGLARALAARPSLMLMDEPFGALDPVTRDELGRAYKELHRELGLTTIMVTHDIGEALRLADRVIVLAGGQVRADAAPLDLFAHQDPEVAGLVEIARRQAAEIAALAPS